MELSANLHLCIRNHVPVRTKKQPPQKHATHHTLHSYKRRHEEVLPAGQRPAGPGGMDQCPQQRHQDHSEPHTRSHTDGSIADLVSRAVVWCSVFSLRPRQMENYPSDTQQSGKAAAAVLCRQRRGRNLCSVVSNTERCLKTSNSREECGFMNGTASK